MKFPIISSLLLLCANTETFGFNFRSQSYPKNAFSSNNHNDGHSGKINHSDKSEFEALHKAKSTILTPTRSIDSLFLRLPSSQQLDELVLSADSVAILKTIQTVATDDSLSCDQKIAYLLEVLGRIRAGITNKKLIASQLEIIIDGAKS